MFKNKNLVGYWASKNDITDYLHNGWAICERNMLVNPENLLRGVKVGSGGIQASQVERDGLTLICTTKEHRDNFYNARNVQIKPEGLRHRRQNIAIS